MVLGHSLDLLDIENALPFHEWDRASLFTAVILSFGLHDGVCISDMNAAFALRVSVRLGRSPHSERKFWNRPSFSHCRRPG